MSFTSSPLVRTNWRDVTISAGAQFFGAFGTFLVMTTLILALQARGADGLEVSALVICEALPMVLLGAVIGAAVDRFDSRWLLVLAGTGQVVACLGLTRATTLPEVLVGAAGLSIATGVAIPTRSALQPAMVIRDDLPRASAIGQTAGSVGMMAGPALAGFLVGGVGPARTIAFAAIGFLATIAAGFALRTRRGRRHTAMAGAATATAGPGIGAGAGTVAAGGQPVGGWSLRDDPVLWSLTWSMAALTTAISAVNVVLVFFVIDTLGGTDQQYGLVDAFWTIGVIGGAWLFGRLIRPGTPDAALSRWLFLTLGVLCAAIIAVGSVPHASWIIPAYLIGGSQNGGLNVLAGTLLGRRVPAAARGRANTALGVRVQGGAMIGMIAGGLLLQVTSPRPVVIGCGVLGVLIVLAIAPLARRAATTPPAAAPPGAASPAATPPGAASPAATPALSE